MGIKLKILAAFSKFWTIFSPTLAFIYLVCWLLQFFNENLFKSIDKLIGFFPSYMNDKMYVEVDLFGKDAPMGYIYSACVLMITMFIAKKICDKIDMIKERMEEEEKARKFRKQQAIKKQKEEGQREKRIKLINNFYALLEFKLEYIQENPNAKDELTKLKCAYSKMIVDKIKEKYPKISFALSDKIFIASGDFSCFDLVIKDLIKLYKIFFDMDRKRDIQTDLLLSFYSSDKMVNPKFALKVLLKVNLLNFTNKVIVSSEIYKRYQEEKIQHLDFIPLGVSRLTANQEGDIDMDIELYYVKSTI